MSFQYDQYLTQHRSNVKRGFDWIAENLPELLVDGFDYGWQIEFAHDKSKDEPDEYEAYDAYFYGGNRSYAVMQNYQKAWLLHLHRNPHHWQYWILINDDPKEGEIVLEMPYNYIIEMICDWWAFSWQKGKLGEIFDWYNEHCKYMKLHPKTRKTIEDILAKMKIKLDEITLTANKSILEHHGIKGQKWGVKNGPPYPIDKSSGHDTIVKNAIESGEVSKKINREKQMRHTKSAHTPGRSYLNGDVEYAQELVDKYSGKGEAVIDGNGDWTHKEKFTDTNNIGTHVDRRSKVETKTNHGMIVYSKTGTHVYPRKEE